MARRGASPIGRDVGAGAIATAPMSAVMLVGQRLGWMHEQPPEHVTEETLSRRAGRVPSRGRVDAVAVAAHVAVGALGGAVFGAVRRAVPAAPPSLLGVAFGLGIWALSYRGWMPAVGVLPPEQRGRRATAVMIASHVAYGVALGALAAREDRR